MTWIRRLFHKHEWRDLWAFDSCYETMIPTGETRVIGRAMMTGCACGAMQRRPLSAANDG